MSGNSFYWHDYETWGVDPRRDRPSQFAGLRTDSELREIGGPLVLYCRPSPDQLPHPEACLITGITPEQALQDGLPEAEFIARIHQELARPGTCGIGYNSLRFDDEVTRFALYRNFFDPYAREWQNGNSRWDLIDVLRLTRALRPQGIEWPQHEDGSPSFRLEQLTAANGIGHEHAHDALSDVRATIGMARLLRQRQPRLYDYVYRMRDKRRVGELLDAGQPLVHASSRYPAKYSGTALVQPLAADPNNPQGTLVYDLRQDPAQFVDLEPEALAARIFTRSDELPEGQKRLPVKSVRRNRCPVLAPLKTLDATAAERLEIDLAAAERHRQWLADHPDFGQRVAMAMARDRELPAQDVDNDLYGGAFFSAEDRRRMEQVRATPPEELARLKPGFDDPRLEQLLWRYRARNWPETLSPEEQGAWRSFCRRRLSDPEAGAGILYAEFRRRVEALYAEADPVQADILQRLATYAGALAAELGLK